MLLVVPGICNCHPSPPQSPLHYGIDHNHHNDDDGIVLGGDTIVWVNSLGLRQQPCGDPVLTMSSADNLFPILTTGGLSVRKFRIGTPRSVSFSVSLPGRMV